MPYKPDTKLVTVCPEGLLTRCTLMLLWALLLFPSLAAATGEETGAPPPAAAEPQQNIRLVTMLTEDESGKPLKFPSAVAYDRDLDEIYVIVGGKGGIVIYGNDYFPYLYLGAGRGITSPQGVFFDNQGKIYVCQGKLGGAPARLTVLNGAFFIEKEIVFDKMPEAEQFSPIRGVIGKNDNIYLAGAGSRGVLVLSADGRFLRWLKPVDKIRIQAEPLAFEKDNEKEVNRAQPPPEAEGPTEEPLEDNPLGLPPELLPKKKKTETKEDDGRELGPVMVNNITRDADGHLFLLSEETSKVYVYGPNEELLFSFGQKGGSTGKMSRPRGIAVDENKKSIYVLDYMRHTILIFDLGGNYLFEFGGRGTSPLWFNFPADLAIDRQGRLLIADLFNNRVQVIMPEFTAAFPKFKGIKGQDGMKPRGEDL